MTNHRKTLSAILGATLLLGLAGTAIGQSASLISQALAAGEIGEQVNGYIGFRGTPSGALRDEVDAINIKRRAIYTALAEQRGKSPDVVAATAGCETLEKRVLAGRVYKLNDGIWRVKGAGPIALPPYCVPSDG